MLDSCEFETTYRQYKEAIECYLFSELPTFETEGQRQLGEAVRYSCEAGGKRIRPVLALATCDLLDGDPGLIMPFAAAIELIHTYSLIHDDMPCMDDDAFRRGQPTCHRVYGEAIALLAGDSALNLAFEVMLGNSVAYARKQPNITKNGIFSIIDAAYCIAHSSGLSGMAGGQAIDLSGRVSDAESLKNLHSLKTGKLFWASVIAPAILCGCVGGEFAALQRYSQNIGLAFQLKDDILDETGSFEKMGKETGGDAKQDKLTFAGLYGCVKAGALLSEIIAEAVESLAIFGSKAAFLTDIAYYVTKRES